MAMMMMMKLLAGSHFCSDLFFSFGMGGGMGWRCGWEGDS